MDKLTEQQISTIKDAASKLTGTKRREFQARVALYERTKKVSDLKLGSRV